MKRHFTRILRALRASRPGPDMRLPQPDLPKLGGLGKDVILKTLVSFALDGASSGELEGYAREDYERFIYTVDLVPEGRLGLLEIGANPYFTSYLLRKFRPQATHRYTNYFNGGIETRSQTANLTGFDGGAEVETFEYLNVNLEEHVLPIEAGSLDVVLFCEVIEHMQNDPLRALSEIKRILRPNGYLVLTTPNVARLENVARLLAGSNIYDPYSGYGPYGRHNREYNRHELVQLLEFCGFEIEICFTADVHHNHANDIFPVRKIKRLVEARRGDLGQYLFVRCRNVGPMPAKKPTWLYRSYPIDQLTDTSS